MSKTITLDSINRKEHYEELVKLMPFKDKVIWAKKKIKEFLLVCKKDPSINEITISFSGGKDSTVLLDLVMKVHSEMKYDIPILMVYATEITFPSTIKFIQNINIKYQQIYGSNNLKNIQLVRPKKTWFEILSENGYPIFSKQVSTMINRVKKAKTKNSLAKWFFGIDKENTTTAKFRLSKDRLFLLDDDILYNWPELTKEEKEYFKKYGDKYFFSEKCCDFIKGNLKHDKRPSFIGTMTEESELRKKSWIKNGCNIYNKNAMKSRPLSIWTKKDIWKYIKEYDLEVNPAYNYDKTKPIDSQVLRFDRLGCTSCPYGSFIEQKKIEIMAKKNPNEKSFRTMNRFEILLEDYKNLYLSQVITNGMYKVLIDMGVKIRNDELYMALYQKRRKQIDDWYDQNNFRNNILSIMCQIENFNDYKNKGKNYTWAYTIKDFNEAMNYFELAKTNQTEITKIRAKIAKQHNKYYKEL